MATSAQWLTRASEMWEGPLGHSPCPPTTYNDNRGIRAFGGEENRRLGELYVCEEQEGLIRERDQAIRLPVPTAGQFAFLSQEQR
jgi:hypothetical protein